MTAPATWVRPPETGDHDAPASPAQQQAEGGREQHDQRVGPQLLRILDRNGAERQERTRDRRRQRVAEQPQRPHGRQRRRAGRKEHREESQPGDVSERGACGGVSSTPCDQVPARRGRFRSSNVREHRAEPRFGQDPRRGGLVSVERAADRAGNAHGDGDGGDGDGDREWNVWPQLEPSWWMP